MPEISMEKALPTKTVIFSHGKESGPWGLKISRLAPVAEELGFAVLSIDYRGVDDPAERVRMLLAGCPQEGGMVVLPVPAWEGACRWQPRQLSVPRASS